MIDPEERVGELDREIHLGRVRRQYVRTGLD
jgi:hypothetical protein